MSDKFKTMYNSSDFFSDGYYEHPVGESMTIPDQSLSVREVIEHFRRGTLDMSDFIDVENGPDETDFDASFRPRDLTDLDDMRDIAKRSLKKEWQVQRDRQRFQDGRKKEAVEAERTDTDVQNET